MKTLLLACLILAVVAVAPRAPSSSDVFDLDPREQAAVRQKAAAESSSATASSPASSAAVEPPAGAPQVNLSAFLSALVASGVAAPSTCLHIHCAAHAWAR